MAGATKFKFTYVDSRLPTLTEGHVIVLTMEHVPDIEALVSEDTEKIFGEINIHDIVYSAYISLGILDDAGKLAGAMCLNDYPNMPTIAPWSWNHWMKHHFGVGAVNHNNSIWIHLLVWDKKYTLVFLKPILQVYFKSSFLMHYIILAIPPGIKKIPFLTESATRILPKGMINPMTVTSLGLLAKQHFITKYKARRAVEEDNDDIVPLIAQYSERLQEFYGEYYIAELLTRIKDSERQIIVAEYDGYAVAVLVLNSNVNYEVFQEEFELTCYHGLKKPNERDDIGVVYASQIAQSEEANLEILLDKELNLPPRKSGSADKDQDEESEFSLGESIWELTPSGKDLTKSALDFSGRSSKDSLATKKSSLESTFSAVLLNYDEYESRLYTEASLKKSTMKIDKKKVLASEPPPVKPIFYGEDNTFVIEVIAAKDGHAHSLELLLEAAFECFPLYNYCVICMPSTDPQTLFLKNFIRVPLKPSGYFPQELFLLHRSAVQAELFVRMAVKKDRPQVVEFLSNMINPGNVMEQFDFATSTDPSLDNSSHLCYLLIADMQLVGLATLSENIDLEYVQAHYLLYNWVDTKQQKVGSIALLENILMYPVFNKYGAFFLAQLHRLADYKAFFSVLTPEDSGWQMFSINRKRPLNNALQTVIPIMPRFVQDYNAKYLEGVCMPKSAVTRRDAPFSLYLSMTRLAGVKRVEANDRIVVVGCGDTCAEFLETLLCTSSSDLLLICTNVVAVSPHGMGYHLTPHAARDAFFIYKGRYCHRYMLMTALSTHLSFVKGLVVEINRKDKRIILQDGKFLPYDTLVMLCGEQFQIPTSNNKKKRKDEKNQTFPDNVFIINEETDANIALEKVKEILVDDFNPGGKVIVYGHNLLAHCCLAGLIEYGVPKDLLVYVNPISPTLDVDRLISYDHLIYSDPDIDIAIVNILKKEGITLYQAFFNDWVLHDEENMAVLAKFECEYRMIDISCKCIFIYTEKCISARTFQAIINAGLVFDGRLVIDADFRTNDPNIYAAGPVTKYSRRYHADHKAHLYYNSEEVGGRLGMFIRNMLLPEASKMELHKIPRFPIKVEESMLPNFSRPIMKSCRVPGGLHYLNISKPGKQTPVELEVTRPEYGLLFVTGDFENLDRQGYFRIHINEFKRVETITCLSKVEIQVDNLMHLWGKHEKLLNNLQLRFELMMIPDLFEFFKEPWTCAIYYDRFPKLMETVNDVVLDNPVENDTTVVEKVLGYHLENEWNHLNESQKTELIESFNATDLRQEIEQKVVEFVEENTMELPMYAHPNLIRHILHDYEKSPMFSE